MFDHSSVSSVWYSLPTAASVRPALPPASYFKFPPSSNPQILIPPQDHPSLASPFQIPIRLYNAALSPAVPITIAIVYSVLVTFMNRVNLRRKYRPWAFSQTSMFKTMVLVHNALLTVYSGWTFIGMLNALNVSIYNPFDEYGLAGTIDSLCKINGPRGLGSAATYNEHSQVWSIANRAFQLGADGLTPDSTDVGRIWNSGLAFYGWLFYLSKFYEVIDTLIILAKGKKSSLLQTYHHAGAMLCMWAGIRYMSAPIWMFVFVNSFVHTIMYSFYFVTALGFRVPKWLKQTLTTLQITQFVVGAIYAFAHLFVEYQSPIETPYIYHFGNIASSAVSDASTAASSLYAAATAGSWRPLLRKIVLRAAGQPGLAENVEDETGHTFGIEAKHAAREYVRKQETRYHKQLEWTPCLDTSGQTFAVLLNCMYLLPLTVLFVQFFIRSYLNRIERRRSSTTSQKAYIASQSGRDAVHGVTRRLSEAFEQFQEGVEEDGDDFAIIDDETKEEIKKEVNATVNKAKDSFATAKKEAGKAANNAKKATSDFVEQVRSSDVTKEISQRGSNAAKQVSQKSSELASEASQTASDVARQVSKKSGEVAEEVSQSDTVQRISQKSSEVAEQVSQSTSKVVQDVKSSNVVQQASERSSEIAETVSDEAQTVKAKAQSGFQDDLAKAREQLKESKDQVVEASEEKGQEADSYIRRALEKDVPKDVPKGESAAEEDTGVIQSTHIEPLHESYVKVEDDKKA